MNQNVMEAGIQFVNETDEIVAGTTSWNDDHDSSDSENAAISSVGNSKKCETVMKPRPGKKTMGRVKIKMEYIKNKVRRYTTFSKRKTGIMKKAYELSALTGTQVMLLVASETGHVYTFATRKLQPIITSENGKALIQTCLNSPDPPFMMSQSLAKQIPQPSEQSGAIPNDSSTKPTESNSVIMEHKAAEPDISKTAILPQLIPLTVDESNLPSAIGQHVSVPLPVSIDSKANLMGNNSGNPCIIPGAMMLAISQPQTSQPASCEPAADKLQSVTQLKEIRPQQQQQQQQQQPVVYYRLPGSDVLVEVPVTPIASPMPSNGARFVYQTPGSDLLLATPTLPAGGLPSDSCLLSIPNTPAAFALTSPEGQQGDNALQQFFTIPAASQQQLLQSLLSSPAFLSEFVDGQFRLVSPSVRKDAT